MKSESLIQYLDEIFESHNKAYGAYVMRKRAQMYLLIAFSIALAIVSTIFVAPFVAARLKPEDEPLHVKSRMINYSELAAPPPIDKNVVLPPDLNEIPKMIRTTLKFLPPVIKPDSEVLDEELPPSQDDLKLVAAGEETVEGNDSIIFDDFAQVDLQLMDEVAKEDKAPLVFAEQMPIYPGGNEALLQFIQEHLRYPKIAIDNGVQGRVFASFVVDKKGKVSKVEIVRGLGFGCDEEAIRVISMLPDWKPGKQNGISVAVKMNIPIQFVLK